MISFFRDFLDGPIYIVVVIISVILIMAIIGFIMERKKFEKEEKEKRVIVEGTTPIEPVRTREQVLTENHENVLEANTELEEQKNDQVLTIDSPEVKVEEVVVVEEPVITKVEDVATVIDFGSTKDIKIDNE